MKKTILTILVLLGLVWCLSEPVDGNLDLGWLIGEIAGFAVVFICGFALKKYYPENE